MQKLTYVFGASVVGIAVCLVMTIVTGVREHHEKVQSQVVTVPAPAVGQ